MVLFIIDTLVSFLAGGAAMYFAAKAGIVKEATDAETAVVSTVKADTTTTTSS